MKPLTYHRPRSVSDAVSAFAKAGNGTRFIAGGTTLYDLMKLDIERPVHLIDVTGIAGLDRIETEGNALRFGALATMSEVAAHSLVCSDYPVIAEALAKGASQQLRNMATMGGNLLQRTRCIYFRNDIDGLYPCNKRAPGSGCAAQDGLDRGQAVLGTSKHCNAVSPGDFPVALTALDAQVELAGPKGNRTVALGDFYLLPGATPHREFAIEPDELITAIIVPKTPAGKISAYLKIRDRESYAFALTSAAVALEFNGNRIARAAIAMGGVGTRPWRADAAEKLLQDEKLTAELARKVGDAAMAGASAGHHNGFKIELGARTVADALMIAAERRKI